MHYLQNPKFEQIQPEHIRESNRGRVLHTLQKERILSRSALIECTGLSRPTVTSVVEELIALGIVKEAGHGHSTGGRPPVLLSYDPSAVCALGASMHNYEWSIVLTNMDAVVEHKCLISARDRTPEGAVQALKEGIAQVSSFAEGRRLLPAIGISLPGLKDAQGDTIIRSLDLNWFNVPIRAMLEEALGLHVFVVNSSIVGALAEFWHNTDPTIHNIIYISQGFGLSAGIILDGQLYSGADSRAGMLSHLVVRQDGLLCSCGNRGCLEASISTSAITEQARAYLRAGSPSLMTALAGGNIDNVTFETAFLAASQQDPIAQQIVDEVVTYLGILFTNLIFTFNPDLIVFGGPISPHIRPLLPGIRERVDQRISAFPELSCQIRATDFGPDVEAMGGAVLTLQQVSDLLFKPG